MISSRPLYLGLLLVLVGLVWHGIQPTGGASPRAVEPTEATAELTPAARARIKVISLNPRAGDRAILRPVSIAGATGERKIEVDLWALVRPGVWSVSLEAPDGTRSEQQVTVFPGDAKVVEILAARHAQVEGLLIERHGKASGSLDIWFLPEGVLHPGNQSEAADLSRTRCSIDGAFCSPLLEPGTYRLTVGPVGQPLGLGLSAHFLGAGHHGVEVHMERGLSVSFSLDRAIPDADAGFRFELQRRVRKPDVTEQDESAWRKVSAMSTEQVVAGRAAWPMVPAGRYRLFLGAGNRRWASTGWDLKKGVDACFFVHWPRDASSASPLQRTDPSSPLQVDRVASGVASSWKPALVWLVSAASARR